MQKNQTLTGIGYMLFAMAALPFIDVFAKYLGQWGVPVLQIVWARLFFGAILTLPFALRSGGPGVLRPDRPYYLAARALFLILATFSFFFALKYLPIADALAIFFIQPLIVVILSALVLRERVGPRRWAAVAVGLVGTIIIIRPGLQPLSPGHFLALAAGTNLAIYFVMTRNISGQAKAIVTTFQTNLIGAAGLSLIVPLVWHAPTPTEWAMMAGLGAVANIGHFAIVKAYDHAEASLLAPLAYTEMIVATIVGWLFFGDFPDEMTFLGVGILIGSALYISWRENKAAKMQS